MNKDPKDLVGSALIDALSDLFGKSTVLKAKARPLSWKRRVVVSDADFFHLLATGFEVKQLSYGDELNFSARVVSGTYSQPWSFALVGDVAAFRSKYGSRYILPN
ncbi:MAG TPA: hypothetical protein VK158_02100 [Acidobacteriota bacterium]|nr:hypothetical protein [Acidobacteriota bacterium]